MARNTYLMTNKMLANGQRHSLRIGDNHPAGEWEQHTIRPYRKCDLPRRMGAQLVPLHCAGGRYCLSTLVGEPARQIPLRQFRELLARAAHHPRVRGRLRGCDDCVGWPRGGEERGGHRGDLAGHAACGTS